MISLFNIFLNIPYSTVPTLLISLQSLIISNKFFFQEDGIQDYSLYIYDDIESIRRDLSIELKIENHLQLSLKVSFSEKAMMKFQIY